jgi:hypothetical protein
MHLATWGLVFGPLQSTRIHPSFDPHHRTLGRRSHARDDVASCFPSSEGGGGAAFFLAAPAASWGQVGLLLILLVDNTSVHEVFRRNYQSSFYLLIDSVVLS